MLFYVLERRQPCPEDRTHPAVIPTVLPWFPTAPSIATKDDVKIYYQVTDDMTAESTRDRAYEKEQLRREAGRTMNKQDMMSMLMEGSMRKK